MKKSIFSTYLHFMTQFNVIGMALGFIIGGSLKDVAEDFIDDVLMPFIHPFLKKITQNEGAVFKIPKTNIKLNLERVMSSTIKFTWLTLMIVLLLQLGVKLEPGSQWVEVRNWKKIRK